MGCATSVPAAPPPRGPPGGHVPSLPPVSAPTEMAEMIVKVPLGAKVGQLLQMTTPHGSQIQCQVSRWRSFLDTFRGVSGLQRRFMAFKAFLKQVWSVV